MKMKNYESRCLGFHQWNNGKFQRFVQNRNDVRLSSSVCWNVLRWPDRHRVATVVFKSNHNLNFFFDLISLKWCDNSIVNVVWNWFVLCLYLFFKSENFGFDLIKSLHGLYEKSKYNISRVSIEHAIKLLIIFLNFKKRDIHFHG